MRLENRPIGLENPTIGSADGQIGLSERDGRFDDGLLRCGNYIDNVTFEDNRQVFKGTRNYTEETRRTTEFLGLSPWFSV